MIKKRAYISGCAGIDKEEDTKHLSPAPMGAPTAPSIITEDTGMLLLREIQIRRSSSSFFSFTDP